MLFWNTWEASDTKTFLSSGDGVAVTECDGRSIAFSGRRLGHELVDVLVPVILHGGNSGGLCRIQAQQGDTEPPCQPSVVALDVAYGFGASV